MAAKETQAAAPLLSSKRSAISKDKRAERAREARRIKDQDRGKTRVNIGGALRRWRSLRDREGFALDSQLAEYLIDCYEKRIKASSARRPKPAPSSSPTSAPQPDPPEEPQITTSRPTSGSLPDKCSSSDFDLSQCCLQNGHTPQEENQPESIEVTLELEPQDEPISGAEEADGESDVAEAEEENEGSEVIEQNGESDISEAEEESEGSEVIEQNGESDVSEAEEESEGSEVEQNGEEENSDEDWTPSSHWAWTRNQEEEEEDDDDDDDDDRETTYRPSKKKMMLCTECGFFYQQKNHECIHKKKPFVCHICGKRCVSESKLKFHNQVHTEYFQHRCKYCYANFKTRVAKLAHELLHQEQKNPYKCPDCEMTFPTFRLRMMHIKQQRDETPFTCTVCGIAFRAKHAFQRHVLVHTGEKAFKCSECKRSFKQASHLKSHMRLHTGERPFSCRHCDKSFNHNVSLKSHVQRYHPTEEEDISVETHETETEIGKENNEENKEAAAKLKSKRPPTGRPKGRPRRNTAKKRKYSKTADDSDEESE